MGGSTIVHSDAIKQGAPVGSKPKVRIGGHHEKRAKAIQATARAKAKAAARAEAKVVARAKAAKREPFPNPASGGVARKTSHKLGATGKFGDYAAYMKAMRANPYLAKSQGFATIGRTNKGKMPKS